MKKELAIDLKQYEYDLPTEKIAFKAVAKRDTSKLLYFNKGKIKDYHFYQIIDLLPINSTLIFNNTKVIPARLQLKKESGAKIELFLLKPAFNLEISLALESSKKVAWQCLIGNKKKWKEGEVLTTVLTDGNTSFNVNATLLDREQAIVEFKWNNSDVLFSKIINKLGSTPLPPYIKRDVEESDKYDYQTVYSKVDGAVAAPTAGLHFTEELLAQLSDKKITTEHLTLHVGAGTFLPIKANSVVEHPMHNETMIVPVKLLKSLLMSEFVVSVGTTSMRTLESLYWFGVKLLENNAAKFNIDKLFPYQNRSSVPSKKEAITAVLKFAKNNHLENLEGCTEIFIFPGYKFKICDGLITNFHQPNSTLILLVAAFVGKKWKDIYNHALQSEYRFLSFGDSSFIIPD